MADKPVLETGALRVRVQVPPPAPPGRAWSRYALRVFSVTQCTSRVLAGIFFVPGRQRDAGLHSFWVQRYFSFSITIEGVSISFAKHRVIFLYATRYQAISRIISRISISHPYRSVLFPFAVWCTWGWARTTSQVFSKNGIRKSNPFRPIPSYIRAGIRRKPVCKNPKTFRKRRKQGFLVGCQTVLAGNSDTSVYPSRINIQSAIFFRKFWTLEDLPLKFYRTDRDWSSGKIESIRKR